METLPRAAIIESDHVRGTWVPKKLKIGPGHGSNTDQFDSQLEFEPQLIENDFHSLHYGLALNGTKPLAVGHRDEPDFFRPTLHEAARSRPPGNGASPATAPR